MVQNIYLEHDNLHRLGKSETLLLGQHFLCKCSNKIGPAITGKVREAIGYK